MSITKAPFGALPANLEVTKFTITNLSGAHVSILNYGGIITEICVPGKDGKLVDVMLGGNTVDSYLNGSGYLGALIGRSGNRFGDGLAQLNGKTLHLAKNSNGHHLHGGDVGFDQKIWIATPDEATNSLVLEYTSPDGEENYPGTLSVRVTYTWSEANALSIHYEATSDKDTLCNLTNHAYFNLGGAGTGIVTDHKIQINADKLTVVDKDCIPTGELRDVTGTPFDFRKPMKIADGLKAEKTDEQLIYGGGYDHNMALNGEGAREAAVLSSDVTGIKMTVTTDLPGIQFYIGNFLDGTFHGKNGVIYQKRDGVCLETQFYPDSPNHKEFKPCVLKAGEKYDTTTTYSFSTT